jgi:hypothetical protein
MLNKGEDHDALTSILSNSLQGTVSMNIYSPRWTLSGYYVSIYIISKDSTTAKAGSPYYIGKGKGSRAIQNHGMIPIPTHDMIIICEDNLPEIEAFDLFY